MRKFNEREKEYLQRLCNEAKPGAFYIAANLFYTLFHKHGIAYIWDSHELTYYRRYNITPDEIKDITDEVIEIAFLLDYLEKKGLIYYIEDNHNHLSDIGVPGENLLKENGLNEYHTKIDAKTEDVLKKTMTYRVIAGQELQEYVDNGFKTLEDQMLEEAKEQSRLSMVAIKCAQEQTEQSQISMTEAQKQTEISKKALVEAQKQTKISENSLKEAQKQTKSANKNTFFAFIAIIISIISLFINKCCTQHVVVDESLQCTEIMKASDSLYNASKNDTFKVSIIDKEGKNDNNNKKQKKTD
ncbi:MAG: hypothetical protein IKO82_07795 [Prevotella sp.]|nr:hypothetical protein [Prevotella sp.]